MSKKQELKQSNEDLAYWQGIFEPLHCIVHGWTYRHSCLIELPSGEWLSVDSAIMELLEQAKGLK
jgi:hypothetical protein